MRSGGGSLVVGITLSWIANRGWGIGLHVGSTGLRRLVGHLVLRGLQGTQSTLQCTPTGTDRQTHRQCMNSFYSRLTMTCTATALAAL